jgi:hypothetical protein
MNIDAKARELTLDELRAVLFYSPETGEFVWRQAMSPKVLAGSPAGWVNGQYLRIRLFWRIYEAHRLAWFYVHGEWPADFVDHVDGDGLNNRLSNLRLASRAENQWNVGAPRTNTSGIKGVSWHSRNKKWVATLRRHGKKVHLGYFRTKEEAQDAYQKAVPTFHGEFARVEQFAIRALKEGT